MVLSLARKFLRFKKATIGVAKFLFTNFFLRLLLLLFHRRKMYCNIVDERKMAVSKRIFLKSPKVHYIVRRRKLSEATKSVKIDVQTKRWPNNVVVDRLFIFFANVNRDRVSHF